MRRRMRWTRSKRGNIFALRWTGQAASLTLGSASIASSSIVAPADYELSATLEPSGAVFMGMHLCYTWSTGTVSTTLGAVFALGVYCHSTDDIAPVQGGFADPRVAGELINEDWLWTTHHNIDNVAATAVSQAMNRNVVRIKSKRRLKDQNITLVVSTDTATNLANLQIVYKARALLKMRPSG